MSGECIQWVSFIGKKNVQFVSLIGSKFDWYIIFTLYVPTNTVLQVSIKIMEKIIMIAHGTENINEILMDIRYDFTCHGPVLLLLTNCVQI